MSNDGKALWGALEAGGLCIAPAEMDEEVRAAGQQRQAIGQFERLTIIGPALIAADLDAALKVLTDSHIECETGSYRDDPMDTLLAILRAALPGLVEPDDVVEGEFHEGEIDHSGWQLLPVLLSDGKRIGLSNFCKHGQRYKLYVERVKEGAGVPELPERMSPDEIPGFRDGTGIHEND